MAIFDSNINYQNLIQITGGTIRIASFVEIRDALTQQFKNIYGSDIDVSSATADGQYINSLALILNNILQTVKFAFDSLDPAVATGKYLDVLCSYNNIQRINATNSVAQIYIYNPTNVTITVSNLQFVDRSGIIWIWKNEQLSDGTNLISFPPGEVTILDNVVCNELGPIEAQGYKFIDSNGDTTDDVSQNDWSQPCPAWINQFVNETSLQLWQYKDAVVGNEEETDEALRSRRYLMLGNQSVSVLEGLQGTLEQLSGIKDVCIINNFNGDNLIMSAPTNDGTNVLGHSIYIALRYKEGVNIDASTIGKLIYNRMTPGIGTTPYGLNTSNPSGQSTAPEYQSFVIQKTDPYHPNWIQMKALLRSDGLDFHFLDNNPSHAEDVLRYLLKTQKYHDRKIKNRAIKFCFDCMQINKLTGIGFFNCLHILREDDFIKVDWEQSLSSSTVDISHCLINFHLFINDHSYQIFINSENEEKDSDDAAVSVYSDNHQIFQVKRLNDDLKKWLRDIVSNEATQSLTYDLAFL